QGSGSVASVVGARRRRQYGRPLEGGSASYLCFTQGQSPHGNCPYNRGANSLRLIGRAPSGTVPSRRLLQLDGGTGLFELALDRVGLFLGEAFLDRVGCTVDEVLRLLEAEARDRADDLDHLDLLAAGLGEHDVEGGLLLRCRCA